MADDGVGDRYDESKSVTVEMSLGQLDELEAMFPDCTSDSERVRRATWMVTNASSLTIERDADEKGE